MVRTFLACTIACALLVCSCANPLKGKPSYWYDGYVYGTRAAGFFAEGKLVTALSFYRKALAQADAHDIPEQSAQYWFNIGRCQLELDKCDSAQKCLTESYRQFSLCGKPAEARQAAGYAALAFSADRQQDSAMAWYQRGVITPVANGDKTFWLMVHGRLVWARDHSREALAYFDEAYGLYKKVKSWHGAAEACFARAKVYRYFGEYDDAARMLSEALSLGDKTDLKFDRWRILLAASATAFCTKDEDKGRWFYERAAKSMAEGKDVPPEDSVRLCPKEMPW